LLVLVWGSDHFDHLLRDAGVKWERDAKTGNMGGAIYILAISIRSFDTNGAKSSLRSRRNTVFGILVRRQLDGVFVLREGSERQAWEEWRIPDRARNHAPLVPIL
jgi:hypothetical protein